MNELLEKNGRIISSDERVEVTSISRNGLLLWVKDKEYYLPYDKFPWFKKATVKDVFDVRLLESGRIRWEALDVDLTLSMIVHPESYPLRSS